MTEVIKRNGEKEPFSEQKVKNSIENAVKYTGYRVHAKKRLIDNAMNNINQAVHGRKEISSAKIRNIVINNLEKWDEDQVPVARAWRNYEQKHGIIHRE